MLKTGVLQMFCRSVFHICIPLVELGLATPVFANVGAVVCRQVGFGRDFEHCFAEASFSLLNLIWADSLLAFENWGLACLSLSDSIWAADSCWLSKFVPWLA